MSSGSYHSHHQSERRDAQKLHHDHDLPQPQAPESFGLGLGDDHPPAAAATSPAPDPESNTALTMTATKKRRMSDNYAQSHLYPYQMQMQESSFFQGWWNEERSSAFASMPNMHKEEASSTDKEAGKKPGPDPQKGGDPNPINDTIIRNNPYRHPHFQFFSPPLSPSHEQFHHFHPPQKLEHPDNNLLPLTAPYSPVRRQFGNAHYMSPGRPAPAAAAHSKKDPPPSAVATEEAKMKANSDGGEDSADLPPPLPFLPVKGICTSTSSQRNAWDRKFNELLEFKEQHGHCDVPQTYAPNPKLGVWVNKFGGWGARLGHAADDDGAAGHSSFIDKPRAFAKPTYRYSARFCCCFSDEYGSTYRSPEDDELGAENHSTTTIVIVDEETNHQASILMEWKQGTRK
eukprot:scaffold19821_cov166-Skeletonema_marinoi.AAC.17